MSAAAPADGPARLAARGAAARSRLTGRLGLLDRPLTSYYLVLGITMLLVMIFLPGGLWSAFRARRRAA